MKLKHILRRLTGFPESEPLPLPTAARSGVAHLREAPSPQHELDLFAGEWSSRLPPPLHGCRAGTAPLFDDARIKWFLKQCDGVKGKRVLELGPLEGGHAWMLEQAGARRVLSVESNPRAYLRCLVVKELLRSQRCRFVLGDALAFLEAGEHRFDVGIASGILYHLVDPLRFIERLCARVDGDILVWSHYCDATELAAHPALAPKFGPIESAEYKGFVYQSCRYEYLDALAWQGFSGGAESHSRWLTRQSLLGAFAHFGFDVRAEAFVEPKHPNGPALAFWARRRTPEAAPGVT